MPRVHPTFAALLGTLSAPMVGLAADRPGTVSYTLFDVRHEMPLDTTRLAVFDETGAARRLPGVQSTGATNWLFCPVPTDVRSDAGVRMLAANPAQLVAEAPSAFVSPVMFTEGNGFAIPTRDILVRFDPEVTQDQAERTLLSAAIGEVRERRFAGLSNAFKVRSNAKDGFAVLDQANALAAIKGVRFAEPDMIISGETEGVPNDPFFPYSWYHSNTGQFGGIAGYDIQSRHAWDITTGSPSIITVILDTGVQQNHPDINQVPGADFTGQGTDGGPVHPCDKHGTTVAGCVSGRQNNAFGISGVAPSTRIASARVMSATDACTTAVTVQASWLVNGIYWAQTIGARITNSSFSLTGQSAALNDAYANTRAAGIVHFGAAGNASTGTPRYPSSLPTLNSVAAINGLGARSWFSNWGPGLDFAVPGEAIATSDNSGTSGYSAGEYAYADGTSYAAPICAGIAALVLSQNPSLTPDQVEQTLRDSCRDLGTPGYDTDFGWGLPSAYKALTGNQPPADAPFASTFNLQVPTPDAFDVPLNPLLNWANSAGATSYLVAIATDSLQETPFFSTTVTPSQFQVPVGLLAQGTTYFWRVVAYNAAGVSTLPSVTSRAFTTVPVPSCPGDVDADHIVNVVDLTAMIGQFGQTVPAGIAPDFSPDGVININDLVVMLGNFGNTCP